MAGLRARSLGDSLKSLWVLYVIMSLFGIVFNSCLYASKRRGFSKMFAASVSVNDSELSPRMSLCFHSSTHRD